MTGPIFEDAVPVDRLRQVEDDPNDPTSLLELAEVDGGRAKVASRLVRWWTAQNERMERLQAEWRVHKARRRGLTQVVLKKSDLDSKSFEVYAPPNVSMTPATFNKADRLCRRVTSFLFTDPPLPEAVPSRDTDEARGQAEVATRVLQDMVSEGGLDDVRTARRAFDWGCTYDCGFRHHMVDPRGGGSQPIQVQVHPLAERLEQAVPEPVDPTTGAPYPGPYVSKYVTEAGELTTELVTPGLRRRFLPTIKTEVLTGRHVRFLPANAQDVWEADGVLLGSYQRWGDLKEQFPDTLGELSEEEVEGLMSEAPPGTKHLLDQDIRDLRGQEANDDALVFTLVHYRKQGGTEPRGVYAVVVGSKVLAHLQSWEHPETGAPLDLPVDQFKQFEDEDHGYGRGLMRQLGGGGDLLAQGYEAVIKHMQRLQNRRVFIPTNSILQPKQLQTPTGGAIPINPGGEPKYEEVPNMPSQYFQFIQQVTAELNDESGLQEVAQGVNTPSVQSGLHARQIIEQSIVSLSDLRQNTERALVRGYRIYLQLIQAFFTVPTVLNRVGDDNQHKVESFMGTDLMGVKDVRMSRGSFTQLSPPAKAAEAERMFAMRDPVTGEPMLSMQQLRHLILGNVGGLIGLQDDPHVNRVKRQLAVWRKGPTEDWLRQQQERAQLLQQLQGQATQLAQVQGLDPNQVFQQLAQQVPPLPTPFDALPVDAEPFVAATRHFHLSRALARGDLATHAPAWIQLLFAAYEQARQAAGIQTRAEQAQAQAQAQQAAAAQQQQAQQQQLADRQAERETRVREKAVEGQAQVLAAREQGRPRVNVDLTGAELLAGAG